MPLGSSSVRHRAGQFARQCDSIAYKACADTSGARRNFSIIAARASPVSAEATPFSESVPPSSSTSPESTTSSTTASSEESTAPSPIYNIHAGVVLSRAPRLTRELTPFEKSFYLYQRRLNERLVLPFQRYFYFKRGTPADIDWKKKYKERLTPARDIGKYSAYGPEAWNDELLVGAVESEPEHQVQSLINDAQKTTNSSSSMSDDQAEEEEIPRPLDRVTEADRKRDFKSLDRLLHRTLYLLVQVKEGDNLSWVFPSAQLQQLENLRKGAERALVEASGPNMNTWMIGYHPIGHYVYALRNPSVRRDLVAKGQPIGDKTFFLKGRILAGQADLADNLRGAVDFKWLAKEEIRDHVAQRYWGSIQNMLAER